MDKIIVKGAREHNLKNIDVELPRDKLIVITGLSGSGKSSLAFDTIYAEGQRRYVESLSRLRAPVPRADGQARHRLDRGAVAGDLDRAEVDLEESALHRRHRHRDLRLPAPALRAHRRRALLATAAQQIASQTVQQMVDRVLELPEGTRFSCWRRWCATARASTKKSSTRSRKQGFVRVNIDGELHDLSEPIKLDKNKKHTIEVYVDRLAVKPDIRQRLTDSIELGAQAGRGHRQDLAGARRRRGGDMLFSEKFACITCGVSYPEITPRMFSFNNPQGACPNCDGIGAKLFFDPDLIVPNEELSLREGAIDPWEKRNAPFFQQILEAVAAHYKIDMYAPWAKLPAEQRKIIMEGSGTDEVDFFFEKGGTRHKFKKEFEGVLANLERRLHEYERRRREEGNRGGEDGFEAAYEEFHRYMNRSPCEECERHAPAQGGALRQGRRACRSTSSPGCRSATRTSSSPSSS